MFVDRKDRSRSTRGIKERKLRSALESIAHYQAQAGNIETVASLDSARRELKVPATRIVHLKGGADSLEVNEAKGSRPLSGQELKRRTEGRIPQAGTQLAGIVDEPELGGLDRIG